MIAGLLWITGCYGFGIVMVHLLYARGRNGDRKTRYVFVTRNNQLHLEWYIRSLRMFAWLNGRNMGITIVDQGSMDETCSIAEKLMQEHTESMEIVLDTYGMKLNHVLAKYEHEHLIVVELSDEQQLLSVPLIH